MAIKVELKFTFKSHRIPTSSRVYKIRLLLLEPFSSSVIRSSLSLHMLTNNVINLSTFSQNQLWFFVRSNSLRTSVAKWRDIKSC